MLLSSRIGLACYLLLPNRLGWACLTREERARVKRGNLFHNVKRPDYADPAKYQDGLGFDSVAGDRIADRAHVQAFLDRVRPASVLEVGPGAGYLTRTIASHPSVQRLVAVDINGAFLEHIRPRLAALRPELSVRLVEGSVDDVGPEVVDAVVLYSAVHHIPDRDELFRALGACLRPGGHVLAVDPTHYLARLRKIWRKVRKPGHLSHQLDLLRQYQFSTHAMCQLAEYRAIAAHTGFRVTRVEFSGRPPKVERWRARGVPLGPLWRWSAEQILVECERL